MDQIKNMNLHYQFGLAIKPELIKYSRCATLRRLQKINLLKEIFLEKMSVVYFSICFIFLHFSALICYGTIFQIIPAFIVFGVYF